MDCPVNSHDDHLFSDFSKNGTEKHGNSWVVPSFLRKSLEKEFTLMQKIM
jgi:hypothetical protein